MKRFIAVISILLLVFWSISALGEGIDLSSMSEQELYELEIAIKEELASRDEFSEVVFFPGDYYVGKDIPAGDYIVHALENNDKNARVFYTDIENNETYDKGLLWPGENQRFCIEDGNRIIVEKGSVVFIQR